MKITRDENGRTAREWSCHRCGSTVYTSGGRDTDCESCGGAMTASASSLGMIGGATRRGTRRIMPMRLTTLKGMNCSSSGRSDGRAGGHPSPPDTGVGRGVWLLRRGFVGGSR